MRPIPNREPEETERETVPITETPETEETESEEKDENERWLELHEF